AGVSPRSAPACEVRERRAAVAELRGQLDLREELAYLAGQVAASSELPHVRSWGQAAPVLTSPAMRALGALTLSLTVAALLGGLFFGTGAVPVLLALGLQVASAGAPRRRAGGVPGPIEERPYDLAPLGGLFARLERERFTSSRLVRLQAVLTGGPASRQVARLHRLHCWTPWALL